MTGVRPLLLLTLLTGTGPVVAQTPAPGKGEGKSRPAKSGIREKEGINRGLISFSKFHLDGVF